MLSMASSDTRLRRAKSTSAAKRGRTTPFDSCFVDSEIAQQHAIRAAHIAMGRANERQSKDISRSDSTTSKQNIRSNPSALHFADEQDLRRHRSSTQIKTSNYASTNTTPTKYGHPSSNGMITPLEDTLDLPTRYGSLPSSYRRLRKAKSTVTPQQHGAQSVHRTPRSAESRMTLRGENRLHNDYDNGLRLRLRRSISFLRSRRRGLSVRRRSRTQVESTDEVVQLAREQFLQDAEDQRIHPKPISQASPSVRRKQQPKAFRKTVRSSRTTDFGDAIASENQPAQSIAAASGRIRNLSRSIRDRVSRLFSRTSTQFDDFPSQHVDASRAYFGNLVDTPESRRNGLVLPGHDEKDPYHRESIYVPSSQVHLIHDKEMARPPSLRSTRSTESLTNNNHSRVTSWTDSTVANSVAARLPVERKRLSIIKETGSPHQPSSSAGMHKYGIPAFQTPLYSLDSTPASHSPVDCQRVYSALLKRLDENEDTQEGRQEPNPTSHAVPERQSHGIGYLNSTALTNVRASRPICTVPCSGSFHSSSAEIGYSEHEPTNVHQPGLLSRESTTPTPQSPSPPREPVTQKDPKPQFGNAGRILFPRNATRQSLKPSPLKLTQAFKREGDQSPTNNENSSVIISRPDHNASATSMSVYSRTTSGNTPARKPGSDVDYHQHTQHAIRNDLQKYWLGRQKNSANEPAATKPSHHYREEAQIFDENDDDAAVGDGVNRRLRYILSPASSPLPAGTPRSRYPLMELKQSPKRNLRVPEGTQSPVEGFVGARTGWGARTGSTTPNDENAKIVLPKRSQDHTFSRMRGKKAKAEDGDDAEEESTPDSHLLPKSPRSLPTVSNQPITFNQASTIKQRHVPYQKKNGGGDELPANENDDSGCDADLETQTDSDDADADKENCPERSYSPPIPHMWNREHNYGHLRDSDVSYSRSRAQGPVLSRNRRLVSDFLRSRRRRGMVMAEPLPPEIAGEKVSRDTQHSEGSHEGENRCDNGFESQGRGTAFI